MTVHAINKVSGLATARNLTTGKTFQFRVTGQTLLKGMKVGNKVGIDAASGKVSVNPGQPCCAIVQALKGGAGPLPYEPINDGR